VASTHNRQRGFTLLEVSIALIVMVAVAIVGITYAQDSSRRADAAATGDWLRAVATAAKAYQKANAAALLAAAGPTTPATASAAQLATLLPPGFSATSPQGHTFTVRWIEPTSGKLDGLVVLQGGEVLPGMSLINVAGQAGGGAGYVDPINANIGKGPRGVWQVNLPDWGGTPGAGRPLYALFYDAAAQDSGNDYLNRTAVAGKPELNRMSTAIDMGGNSLANANAVNATNVDASSGVRAAGLSIGRNDYGATPYPYETIQLQGGMNMRFANGTREHAMFGSDGTSTFYGNINSGGSIGAAATVSAANMVASSNVSATTMQAQEIYANGWFRSRGNGGWYSESYGGGWHMTDPTWIRAYNNKSIYTAGEMRAGTVSAEGRLSAHELVLGRVETEGAGCGEWGLTARSSDGKLLSCTGGVWKGAGGLTTTVVQSPVGACNSLTVATCPAGTTLISGGFDFVSSCNGQTEMYRFTTINRPSGNSWVTLLAESRAMAYAVCAR
jgi:type II secretory pathway pseudopilin PulG